MILSLLKLKFIKHHKILMLAVYIFRSKILKALKSKIASSLRELTGIELCWAIDNDIPDQE